MTRNEIAKETAINKHMHLSTTMRAIEECFRLISESLALGEDVNIHDFGSFKIEAGKRGGRSIVFRPCSKLLGSVKANAEAEEELLQDLKDACFDIIVAHPGISEEDWVWKVMESCPMEMADAGVTQSRLRKWWSKTLYRDGLLGQSKTFAQWSAYMPIYLRLKMDNE